MTNDDHSRVLSSTYGIAVLAFAQAAVLGHHFLRNKRTEWRDFRRQVTEFELDRYLPLL
jgi:glutamine synthetase